MNRAALFQTIEPLIELSASQRESIRTSFDKILIDTIPVLPLTAARSLPAAARSELAIVLRDILPVAALAKVSAAWEPLRKLDDHCKQTLRVDLIDLLNGERELFAGLKIVSLAEARQAGPGYRTYIEKLVPTKDAGKLLRAWDKNFKTPTARPDILARIGELLAGAEPIQKTKAPSRRAA